MEDVPVVIEIESHSSRAPSQSPYLTLRTDSIEHSHQQTRHIDLSRNRGGIHQTVPIANPSFRQKTTRKKGKARQLPVPPSILNSHLKKESHQHSIHTRTHANTQRNMAQGKVKGMQTSKQKATRSASSSSTTKKGKRYIAPKKADAIKIASLKKVRMQTIPHLSPSLGVGNVCWVRLRLNVLFTGPQLKDQPLHRATHRQRGFIWETHNLEERRSRR
jgi:hypothetical protein